ncbi:MAG: glycosyltransferase [Rickettsiales bacterium]|nr:glycosyltransferase [Rickettsiales bacterium]
MKLLIRGPFFLKGNGYASALKAHINVFADVFEQTKFENFKPIGLNEVESNSYNDFITKNLISSNWKPDVTINYLAPNVAQKYRGCFNIIFTYWETDLIPGNANSSNRTKEKNNWVQQLNGYDLVLTASSYAKQAFIDSGVVRPIEVLPWPLEEVSSEVNALNTNFLNVINGEERGLFEIQANSSFILSSIGEYQARKNFHQLIKNFIITFYNDNSKALILKLSNTGVAFYKSNIIIQDIQHYIKSIKLPEPVRCSIYVSTEHLRKSEIINILQSSDYYITTSRGEGMGGPVIEALDLGVPVISGWHTSLKDF